MHSKKYLEKFLDTINTEITLGTTANYVSGRSRRFQRGLRGLQREALRKILRSFPGGNLEVFQSISNRFEELQTLSSAFLGAFKGISEPIHSF